MMPKAVRASQLDRPARVTHREALIEGAIRCIQDKGYARTTARDLVAASHTNLGSIGYHYGSKEALLNEALAESFRRWLQQLLSAAALDEQLPPWERLQRLAEQLPATFEQNRPLVVASFEALAQAERSDAVRDAIARSYRKSRDTIATLIGDIVGDIEAMDAATRRTIATVLIAVFDGLLIQWFVNPEEAPTGQETLQAFLTALAALDVAGLR